MKRLILVRHGESLWNVQERIQGHSNSDLSERGIEEAKKLAQRLRNEKIDVIYTSDLKRAYKTAKIIQKNHSAPIYQRKRLREAYFGLWEGLQWAEVEERYPKEAAAYREDLVKNRAPQGEQIEAVVKRVGRIIDEIKRKYKRKTALMVAHSGPIRAAIIYLLGLPLEAWKRMQVDNASITIFEFPKGKPFLKLFNDTCHLRQ